MPYPTDVKLFYWDPGMTSVPAMAGSATSYTMISALDACLVNGYGLKTIDTLVVSGGIATATIGSGHEYGKWQVALIAGATPAGLNGEKRILSRTATSFTFDATGIADQTATGTITSKIAPLGWVKEFSGTGKGVYRINLAAHPTAPPAYLRVDDTNTNVAVTTLFESMTDVDTGVDRTPTVGQYTTGVNIMRATTSASTNIPWLIIGDSRGFYVCVHYDQPSNITNPEYGANIAFVGELVSPDETDPYRFVLAVNNSNTSAAGSSTSYSLTNSNTQHFFRQRSANRISKSPRISVRAGLSGQTPSGGQTGSRPAFPDQGTNKILLFKHFFREIAQSFAYSGEAPGYYFIDNQIGQSLHSSRLERIYDENPSALPGRVLLYMLTVWSSSTPGVSAFDITGPWR